MNFPARLIATLALSISTIATVPVSADYEGADGYGKQSDCKFDVSRDGYVREGEQSVAADPTTYVVIEADSGTTQEVDGETIIVVQEPEPVAATEEAPPPPQTVVVEQPSVVCPQGIWVEGHWTYGDGDYAWVDGHCVVERVNYVFVQPRWDYYSSVWWYVPGYYRPYGVYVGFGYHRPRYWYPPYYHPYYRAGRPVPVHRSVSRRPTTVHPTSVSRRGVMPRPGYGGGRTPTVERRPPVTNRRTSPVGRVGGSPTRTGTVSRTPTRTLPVDRGVTTRSPTRTSVVGGVPATRTTGVSRGRPSVSRVDTVGRARPTTSRTNVVGRPPTSTTRTGTVGRAGARPTMTRTSAGARPSSAIVSRPRPNPSRTSSVARPSSASSSRSSVSRTSAGSSRSGSVSRPRTSRPSSRPARAGGFGRSSIGRPSSGGARPSGGRSGGFSRPSSAGFGGSRSVPTARGR